MAEKTIHLAAGGILFEDGRVLLVKPSYGANKGSWLVPGGNWEPGESVEETAIREVFEETGLRTRIRRLVSVRSGVQERAGENHTLLYFIFEVERVEGTVSVDSEEISEARYWSLSEIECSKEVIELTKNVILSATGARCGLFEGREIRRNTSYASYHYYIPDGSFTLGGKNA